MHSLQMRRSEQSRTSWCIIGFQYSVFLQLPYFRIESSKKQKGKMHFHLESNVFSVCEGFSKWTEQFTQKNSKFASEFSEVGQQKNERAIFFKWTEFRNTVNRWKNF
jgi:hypothetical protein